ncbi:MAG TPA: VWA domain-containing protein [Blastocatellia bacterium]|nr:VWA domain-containing protein [Blastocatellia bacterium]HMZ18984.1 VWA domain-containing protein [Blastocatellia bacterium]HNG32461.1 VWA domain-containing protein [Blastocatellia bacterium]
MRCLSLFLLLVFGLTLLPANAQKQDPKQDPKQTPKKQNPVTPPDKQPEKPDDAQDPNQANTFKFETNLVVLNATITDGGDRYVRGLKREDFQIFEDKVQQKIVDFSQDETAFTAVILLDASLSMQHKLTLARAACANFVDTLRPDDTFAIYGFSGMKVKVLQDFTEIHDIPDSVWDMRADGETPLYDAIVKAAEGLAKRTERRRAIVVVSDGADTKSKASLEEALRKTLDAQALIYAVDMTDASVYRTAARDGGLEILKEMAAKTGGRFFNSAGGATLREAFAKAAEELRNQYTLTYESSNEKYDGRWRTLEVRVSKPLLSVRTRRGYYARKNRN